MLNLVISHVSDIYDQVQQNKKQAECEFKCKILGRICLILFLFSHITYYKQFKGCNRKFGVYGRWLGSPFIFIAAIIILVVYVILIWPIKTVYLNLRCRKTHITFEGGDQTHK